MLVYSDRGITNATNFAVMETKVTSNTCLAENQLINYPQLLDFLRETPYIFLLLQSIGAGDDLYRQAVRLQGQLAGRFAILLWEEVFRVMLERDFAIPGLPPSHLARFTEAFDDLAAEYPTGEA